MQASLGIPPIVTSCAGDLNFDGVISYLDFSSARRCFGFPAEGACTLADLDGNGFVSVNDLIRIGRSIGQTCAP